MHGDQLRALLHLLDHADLYRRRQVPQHQELTALVAVRNDRLEIPQHIQIRHQRIPGIHIQMIFPAPEKGFFIRNYFHSLQVYPAALQLLHFLLRKIIAYDGYLVNRLDKITSRISDISSGSPYDPIGLSERASDTSISHSSYNN